MIQFSKTEAYGGVDIIAKVTTDVSSQQAPGGGTQQMHVLRFYFDDDTEANLQLTTPVTEEDFEQKYTDGLAFLKNQIDDKNSFDKKLEELGFTEDGSVDQVATPTGFAASQPGGAGTDVLLTWDVVGPVELYEIQVDTDSGYSTAYTISEGDTTPYSLGPLPTGMRYFRIRAKIAGMTDSDWATTSINVL